MKNQTILIILFSFILLPFISGQDRLGLRIDNYSGVNGLLLNPANGTHLPYTWDLNLASIEIFAENNYGYIGNTSIKNLAQHEGDIVIATDYDNENEIPSNALVADYNKGKRKYYAQGNVKIMGPSLLINFNQKHSAGFITAFRVAGGSRNLPGVIGYYDFEEYPKFDELIVKPFKMAAATWAEIGLHYGYKTDDNLAFGVNAKYLMGYEGAYFNSYQKAGVTKQNDNEIEFLAADAEFGLTNTYTDNQTFEGIQKNGGGISLDLGVTYTIDKEYDDGYQLKLGASLIDLGYIRFNKNAESHRFDNVNLYTIDLDEYQSITEYDQLITLANEDVFSNQGQSLQSNSFNIALPTALSLQADYSLTKNVFVNASMIQHIPLGKNRIARTDVFAITPRFEHRWFGAMVPINMINYDQVHVGLSLRLAYLTIGSENLTSLFGKSSKFTGTDFYLALKVNPFKIKKEKDKRWKSRDARGVRNRGRGKVKCYDF